MLQDPPTTVVCPDKPGRVEQVEGHTQQSERERQNRKAKLNVIWRIWFEIVDESVIFCGEKPRKTCDTKTVSIITYLLEHNGDGFSATNTTIWNLSDKRPNNCGKQLNSYSLASEK